MPISGRPGSAAPHIPRRLEASDLDGHLASCVPLLQTPDRLGDLIQPVGPVDDRRHLRRLDELSEDDQVRLAPFRQEVRIALECLPVVLAGSPSLVPFDDSTSFSPFHNTTASSRATQGSHHRSATAATLGSRILEPGLFGVVAPLHPQIRKKSEDFSPDRQIGSHLASA